MNALFVMFAVLMFLAVVLALEGISNLWRNRQSETVKRIAKRLEQLQDGAPQEELNLERALAEDNAVWLDRFFDARPWGRRFRQYVRSAGGKNTAGTVLQWSAVCVVAGGVLALVFGRPWLMGLMVGATGGALPWWKISSARDKRIKRFEQQLPEAMDMIGRAIRAGQAFPMALRLCGQEMTAPLGPEFRQLSDEISYGVPMTDALRNLARRIPLNDVSYFVVAVTIQRESGGNLAEVLDNISRVMRERFKLMGEVRTLSAEGRMSAWVLGLIPFVIGSLVSVVNPGFISVLWTDPMGQQMLTACAVAMAFGTFWISRIVKIRV